MDIIDEHGGIEIDGLYYDKEDIQGILRIQNELLIEEGLLASIEECINIWNNYSNTLFASWLFIPQTNIVKTIKSSQDFKSFELWANN